MPSVGYRVAADVARFRVAVSGITRHERVESFGSELGSSLLKLVRSRSLGAAQVLFLLSILASVARFGLVYVVAVDGASSLPDGALHFAFLCFTSSRVSTWGFTWGCTGGSTRSSTRSSTRGCFPLLAYPACMHLGCLEVRARRKRVQRCLADARLGEEPACIGEYPKSVEDACLAEPCAPPSKRSSCGEAVWIMVGSGPEDGDTCVLAGRTLRSPGVCEGELSHAFEATEPVQRGIVVGGIRRLARVFLKRARWFYGSWHTSLLSAALAIVAGASRPPASPRGLSHWLELQFAGLERTDEPAKLGLGHSEGLADLDGFEVTGPDEPIQSRPGEVGAGADFGELVKARARDF